MKRLLQLDKLDGDRKDVIMTIAETGGIVGNVEESFPARMLTKPQIFVSLLFYYGMLTIKGTKGDRLVLGIPNNNVRKQYYEYLVELYEEKAEGDTFRLSDCFYDMAYEGKWQDAMQFLADSYAKASSVRDGIEAERNMQGFFMAYLSLYNYYYTAPELEFATDTATSFSCPTSPTTPRSTAKSPSLKSSPRANTTPRPKTTWPKMPTSPRPSCNGRKPWTRFTALPKPSVSRPYAKAPASTR